MTGSETLIIFTRYPIAGTTKTRLIPALGAVGAAALQRQMTEHTVRQAQAIPPPRDLQGDSNGGPQSDPQSGDPATSVGITICYAGGDRPAMEAWLGSQFCYTPQSDGDLGDRMLHALHAACEQGAARVVIIGVDCPDLDATRMRQAFDALKTHDLVLGPATDGGYYLIGSRQPIPALFSGVEWGTHTVLQTTVAIAQSLNLSVAFLDPLNDVDRPEDLPVWAAVQGKGAIAPTSPSTSLSTSPVPIATPASPSPSGSVNLSIIIPALNEAATLPFTLADLGQRVEAEVIVVDGGSHDDTVAIAEAAGVRVIRSAPGRAHQMNQGATAAAGDVVLFLHADTRLPADANRWIAQILSQPGVVAGAFELQIEGEGLGLRWVEWGGRWRSRLLQLPYGDQAIFIKADTFRELGGFSALPIMEDFELMRRLRRYGRIAIAPVAAVTSARRWQRVGVLRTTVVNQLVILAFFLGVSPERIARGYRQVAKKN